MSPHPKLAQLAGPALRVQPDRRLARLAGEGNEAAFEEIVRRYRPRLVSFAAAIVPAHRAEDIVQESLARVYTALAESDGDVHLGPWLYTIVRNRSLNAVRDERIHVELDEQHDYVPPPLEVVARRAELAALVAGMRQLPEAQREALVQRELEGRTHDQIAARLGTSPASVRGLIFRARTALRQATGALLPIPLLRWLTADEARAGVAETAGGMAAAGAAAAGASGTGIAAKAGAVVVAAALATSAGVGLRGPDRSPAPPGSSSERAEAFARGGNDEGQPGNVHYEDGDGQVDNSGPGSLSSGPGSSGSDSSGSGSSGSSGSGSSGSGSSGSDSSDSGSSGSGSSESGSSGSGSSGPGSSESGSSGSGSSGSDSSGSGSSGSGSGSSGSDSSGSG